MGRKCAQCGAVLSQYNPGKLCFSCQEKQLEQQITGDEDMIDAEEFARMLRLKNAASVKRLAQKGKLPLRIPAIKQYRWLKNVVEEWIKQEGIGNKDLRMAARGIASNMRACRNDPVICLSLSDKIGSKVYGQQQVLGTTDAGRVEPITLVKVDRALALKVLKRLPKEDFPELTSITDWADLIYDKINEDLIVRLEAHF